MWWDTQHKLLGFGIFLFTNKYRRWGLSQKIKKEEHSGQGLLHSQKVTGKVGQNPVCLSNISLCGQQALAWLWVWTPWKSCTALVWFIWFLTHQVSWYTLGNFWPVWTTRFWEPLELCRVSNCLQIWAKSEKAFVVKISSWFGKMFGKSEKCLDGTWMV